ncbi:MAG: DUF1501 domain-containing protein [Candidatus Kapaibacteriales bacterium]
MNRRNFLQSSALAGSALALTKPAFGFGKPKYVKQETFDFMDNDNIMIIIELFGGNDGLNTIIPVDSDIYYQMRPNVAIQKEEAIRWESSQLYFHPALVTDIDTGGFLGMMDGGQLAIIENVGYENPTLSHFRSKEIWQSGINNKDPKVKLEEGWLGRFIASKLPEYPLVLPEHPVCISMEGTVPLIFKSKKGHMGISVREPETFGSRSEGLKPNFQLFQGDDYYTKEFNFLYNVASQSEQYGSAVTQSYENGQNLGEYSDTRLSRKFKDIARMISGGLKTKVYYVGLSNFDSHVQQMSEPLNGQHPLLLNELARAVSEFMRDATLQGFAKRIAGMTTSEFGRRVQDNGSRGTDHGTASSMFVFGHFDYVNGATYGDIPDLSDLNRGNLRHQYDFRMVYADFLEKWFGATDDEIDDLFQENMGTLNVLNARIKSVEETALANANQNGLKIYPNPSSGNARISFKVTRPIDVKVSVYTETGHRVYTAYHGPAALGDMNLPIKLNTSGKYIVEVKAGKTSITGLLIIR